MFFAVVGRPQTWKNLGYLLLAFPLGIAYFVFLVTGLSLGFGLVITLLGIPILVGVLAGAYGLGDVERRITNELLGCDTPAAHRLAVEGGLWAKVKALVRSSETWKRVGYLLLEFPFGIVGLTLVTTTAAFFTLVATPVFYAQDWWITDADWPFSWWTVDTIGDSLLVAVVGVLVGYVLLHLINAVATAWGRFARLMLGPTEHVAILEHRSTEKTPA